MSGSSRALTYPPEGVGAPKHRRPGPLVELGLPVGTEVFSADDHISLADDIFYERFPESMKERAPRVMNVDGGWVHRCGREVDPRTRVHRGPEAVRPSPWIALG